MPALKVLERTRSQHFVASPRKTPFKRTVRHPSKRRRLGSNTAQAQPLLSSSSSSDQDPDEKESAIGDDLEDSLSSIAGPSRSREALSSEAGLQTLNRPKGKARRKSREHEAAVENKHLDVFGSGGEASPKKRKRGQREVEPPRSETSGSWVEMDEDEEEEPEFIAESKPLNAYEVLALIIGDQHLLQEAPTYALHRLRKAELVRLWKVAGMWTDEHGDDITEDTLEEDNDGGLTKHELVDGLIAAVCTLLQLCNRADWTRGAALPTATYRFKTPLRPLHIARTPSNRRSSSKDCAQHRPPYPSHHPLPDPTAISESLDQPIQTQHPAPPLEPGQSSVGQSQTCLDLCTSDLPYQMVVSRPKARRTSSDPEARV